MGGIGIGMSHGAETALSNPALITSVKGTEISFGGTVFMPDVATSFGAGYEKSDADLSVIPEVAITQNVGDGISWGVGMFGVAGMGTDYRDSLMTSNLIWLQIYRQCNLQYLAYKGMDSASVLLPFFSTVH
jgi:long-chain fatty acid transport protein